MAISGVKNKMKVVILFGCKLGGLFSISRWLTKNKLRILCYHGFELVDEVKFRPGLFIQREVFEQRLKIIRRLGFPVLPLNDAMRRLDNGTLPSNAVCITIDDGFYSVFVHAAPLLKRYGFPATVYVTSYYVEKNAPIFRLAIQYMFWKAAHRVVDLSDEPWGLAEPIDLALGGARAHAAWHIIHFGEKHCSEPERQSIAEVLGEKLSVPYEEIKSCRALSLLTPEELRQLSSFGLAVQLHTHRHRELPGLPKSEVLNEVHENRQCLEEITGQSMTDFCYPSGQWDSRQWAWLGEAGIRSAVTCEPGLNTRTNPVLGLHRILDSSRVSQIVFEAKLCGFYEALHLMRRMRRGRERTRTVHGKDGRLDAS